MDAIAFLFLCFALWVSYRGAQSAFSRRETRRVRREDFERTRHVLELDPTNAGTRAKLAAFLVEDGDLEAGIHEFRTAIAQMPHGPFTTQWKRQLREALDIQEMTARGERAPGFTEWRVCPKCQAKVLARTKNCPKCGERLHMSFGDWFLNVGTQRDIWRESLPIALVLWICAVVFSSLPLEWKGTLAVLSALVGGWLVLRSFNK